MDQLYYLKSHNFGEPIVCTLYNALGVADLTGCISISFIVSSEDGGDPIIDAPATNMGDPTDGIVGYTWQATDTAKAGRFVAEWKVMFPGVTLTFPNKDRLIIDIAESLG